MFGVLPSNGVSNIDLCKTDPTNRVLIPTICLGFNCILGPLHPHHLPFGHLLAWEIFSFSKVRTLKKLTTRPKSWNKPTTFPSLSVCGSPLYPSLHSGWTQKWRRLAKKSNKNQILKHTDKGRLKIPQVMPIDYTSGPCHKHAELY